MKFTQLAIGTGGLIAALAGQPAAVAANLDITAFGSFQNVSAGPDTRHSVFNNDQTTQALLVWGEMYLHDLSRLGFDGRDNGHGRNRSGIEVGTPFQIGKLSWLNGTSGGAESGVNALDMLLSVGLGGSQLGNFVFGIEIENTPDTGRKGSPDHLKLVHDFGSYHFNFAGQDYSLDFLGLSTRKGEGFSGSLSLAEGRKLQAGLYAVINSYTPLPPEPQAVPVPAAIWLFGSGLVGLAGLARRR